METDARGSVERVALVSAGSKEYFRDIWHVESIQIGKTDDGFWLKGFSQEDVKRVELRAIPGVQFFELKGQFLYLPGNRVPERKFPLGVLWHPIQQALKVELPSFNENLFTVEGDIQVELAPHSVEQPAKAFIVELDELVRLMNLVPSNQYQQTSWCVFGENKALLLSKTVFPIVSNRFWQHEDLFIPVGYDFKYSYLKSIISKSQKLATSESFWLFDTDGTYAAIPKSSCQPLSRASVQLTLQQC